MHRTQVVPDRVEVDVLAALRRDEGPDLLRDARVMTMRDARKEVVLDLVVQAAVQDTELLAADVRRRRGLLLEEPRIGLVLAIPTSIGPFREVHAVEVMRQEEEERQVEAADGRHPQTDGQFPSHRPEDLICCRSTNRHQ